MRRRDFIWMFTLGQPPSELMDLLAEYTRDGALDWLIVVIPERPGQERLDFLPADREALVGVR